MGNTEQRTGGTWKGGRAREGKMKNEKKTENWRRSYW